MKTVSRSGIAASYDSIWNLLRLLDRRQRTPDRLCAQWPVLNGLKKSFQLRPVEAVVVNDENGCQCNQPPLRRAEHRPRTHRDKYGQLGRMSSDHPVQDFAFYSFSPSAFRLHHIYVRPRRMDTAQL